MKAKRLQFVVEIDQPEGAYVKDVLAYIEDAVGSWSGSLMPDDPLFRVGRTATVKRLHKRKQYKPGDVIKCAECGAPTTNMGLRCDACVRTEVEALVKEHPEMGEPSAFTVDEFRAWLDGFRKGKAPNVDEFRDAWLDGVFGEIPHGKD